ncbi:MAG: flagellin [Planctomycetaceae bacterium]|jgi:flagellin-like hook-associated protein FlgL|nr:flagellin [Planctomycetaceae bacterium]
MTGLYVASNVQSLVSQHQINRNMADLSNILTRLSTGLRINSGKDDPAGLIASELLKSDMTATTKAISNAQRANSVIAIADSALGQVSSLLNDIRGLINEAANTGAMTAEQIAANQLQVDASLDSIDRIAKTTNYQGQLLLDGSMGFQTQGLSNVAVRDLNIHEANFGTQKQVDVSVDVIKNAEHAQLFYDKAGISSEVVMEVIGNLGNNAFRFEAGATVTDIANAINQVSDATGVQAVVGNEATAGQIMLTSAGFDNDVNLTSLLTGAAAGSYTIKFTAGNSNETTYTITEPQNGNPGIIDFKLKMEAKAAPAVKNFDESFNGLYSYDITGDSTGGSLVVQSTNGTEIRQVEFVKTGTDASSGSGHTSPDENTGVAVTFDKITGKLQILYSDSATIDEAVLRRAINAVDGLEYVSGTTMPSTPGSYNPADLRANNALNITSTIPGSKFENTDIVYVYDEFDTTEEPNVNGVALAYKDSPQYSAATIKWGDGSTTDPDSGAYDVQLRIVAKQVGAEFNDVTINFEQDDTFAAGDVEAVYDAKRKILHIRGQIDNDTDPTLNATYGSLKAAIEEATPFKADVTIMQYDSASDPPAGPYNNTLYPLSNKIKTGLVTDTDTGITQNKTDNSYIKTGQVYGDIGTDHQTLFIRVNDDAITAQDVVDAFNASTFTQIAANFTASNAIDSNGTGTIFSADLDRPSEDDYNVRVRVFSGVLTGGANGFTTAVTAKELTDFINADSVLSTMFRADIPINQIGNGLVTLFDEAAYYGSTLDETALQFLGPEGSPDILFVNDGANSELGISFSNSQTAECIADDRPVASLQAKNANASFTLQTLRSGDEFNDMVVRLIRLDNNHIVDDSATPPRDDSYVQYKSGLSNAMAYCSINDNNTGEIIESGKFIVYGVQGGTQLNNVSVIARLDESQTEAATAKYDEASKQLVLTVNSKAADVADGAVTLSDAVAAINNTGIFHAEYDYSFNTDPGGDADTGPGLETFGYIFSAAREMTIGNTGDTGGHNGVLEVYIAGNAEQITGQRVVDTINSDPVVSNLFAASTLGGTDAGTGLIDFRADNIRTIRGADGQIKTEANMLTDILGSSGNDPGYMIVHLATDSNGYSITSARDLVNFMNQLTAEQTKGISVSLVRPAGVDNLNRTWTVDSCGNVIETQGCEDDYGKGILQPTMEVDDCDNITYLPIEFKSFGENIVSGNAYGSIIAVNGQNASLEIHSKIAGPEFNGVGFKYIRLEDPLADMYAEYDAYNKEISVYIQEGVTAGQVKNIIESSEGTRNLFSVTLTGDGTGAVTTQDDYLVLKHGLYDAGYRGGALMLGAADADEHRLVFESVEEGSRQQVSVKTVVGDFEVKNASGIKTDTDYGADMVATLNGYTMGADGRKLSLNTTMLKLDITLDQIVSTGDSVKFSITGGGATFQIGPDVVSNQQVRLGIGSVSTARLGGSSGRLYQLRSGGNADLTTDTKLADRIVQEAILSIATTRGRLGAIQRSTLEPTIAALQDSLEQLTSAEAQISNADFAEESSKLTRAQILVQSGTTTLSIANQFPQYAASLLGG